VFIHPKGRIPDSRSGSAVADGVDGVDVHGVSQGAPVHPEVTGSAG